MRLRWILLLLAVSSGVVAGCESAGGDGGAGGTGAGGTGGVAGRGGEGGTGGRSCDGVTCDDDNPCTDDSCEPGFGCVFLNHDRSCDDENACSADDRCFEGRCVGTPITCIDDNPCTDDACMPATGCIFTPRIGPCEDGNACTVGDACIGGVCGPGAARNCDDQSSCTSETCDPVDGCEYANLCDAHATCLAAACECNPGYEGDGYVCSEIPPVCFDGLCSPSETYVSCPSDCDHDLVIVVEEALARILAPSLMTYLRDLDAEGYLARIEPWTPGTVEDLKSLLFAQVDTYGVEGALLIGNLPAAWYEQVAFDRPEEFPLDVFLEDRDAVWRDDDDDGIYDDHSELELDIYVSRLQTLPHPEDCVSTPSFPQCPDTYDAGAEFYASEACILRCPSRLMSQNWSPPDHPDVECCGTYFLKRYFDRIHDYRAHGSLVDQSAFVFVDDAWRDWGQTFQPFGLDDIYTTVDVILEPEESTKNKYVEMLSGGGSEYVYHFLHASPSNLFIYVAPGSYSIHRTQIGWSPFSPPAVAYHLELSFINMFSCLATRFTVPNLGMSFVFQTDSGLAVVGTTKNGGMFNPFAFHASLASGTPWGESFRLWYNQIGNANDEWNLGMVLLGDPLLTLSGDIARMMELGPLQTPTSDEIEALRRTITGLSPSDGVDTFEDYKRFNPQFFAH
ncbi:MAG: hypothetical protein WBM46_12795 [Polyangiales bacterium]